MTENAKLFWATADCLKPESYKMIISLYGDLDTAMEKISESDLKKIQMHPKTRSSILKKIHNIDTEKIKELCKKYGVSVLCHEDEYFPESLKKIDDAPLFLFAKGNFNALTRKSLAVVGTRSVTNEGKWACDHLLPDLIKAGFTIVSGMAAGIDTIAHKSALENGGATIAFWGTGLDLIYPSANKNLATDIMKSGVIFSEFPFGTPPARYNFPRRNRLVSGYSDGVLIVEGKEKSGSLITADFAMEQGKDVFAVPGPIRSPLSRGPHKLIKEGAILVQDSADILDEFGVRQEMLFDDKIEYLPANDEEKLLYNALSYSPLAFDLLIQKTQLSSSQASSVLMMMSLSGAVEDVGGGMWVRR